MVLVVVVVVVLEESPKSPRRSSNGEPDIAVTCSRWQLTSIGSFYSTQICQNTSKTVQISVLVRFYKLHTF